MNSQSHLNDKITQIYNSNNPPTQQASTPIKGKWPKKKNNSYSKFDELLTSLRKL